MRKPLPRIYFYADGPHRRGPFTLEEIRYHPLKTDTLVWREGLPVWTALPNVPELWAIFAEHLAAPAAGVEQYRLPDEVAAPATTPTTADPAGPGTEPPTGMALASTVLGALSLPAWCVPGSFLVALPAAVAAVVTGALSRRRSRAAGHPPHALATAGLWLGGVNLVLVAVVLGITAYFAITAPPPQEPTAPPAQAQPDPASAPPQAPPVAPG